MEFFYENQGTSSFLSYKLTKDDVLDGFNYGMIANNKINNIIPAIFSQINEERYLKYNVSAKVSLTQYFEGFVNKKQVVNVFMSIAAAIIDSEDYMIDQTMFVLDPDYIYVDVSTANACIICFPVVGKASNSGLLDFYKNLIFKTSYDQTEDTDYVAKIISFLNANSNFSLPEFRKMLGSLDSKTVVAPKVHPQAQSPVNIEQNAANPANSSGAASPNESHKQTAAPTPAFVQPQNGGDLKNCQSASKHGVYPANKNASQSGGFQIPEKKGTLKSNDNNKKSSPMSNPQTEDSTEKMSFMYLLNHFSKENLETYKAQKNGNQTANQQPQINIEEKKKLSKKQKNDIRNIGNPIPGFDIPGSQQPYNAVANNQNGGQKDNSVMKQQPKQPQPAQSEVQRKSVINTNAGVGVYKNSNLKDNGPIMPSEQGGFGGTTVLGGSESFGTTVLGASGDIGKTVRSNPRLIRNKTQEIIPINKPVFRLGKERSYVDYFVTDNSAVSRSHANICSKDDDGYYIVDTNSTNHTYVNGNMIQSNVEFKLNDKDIIKLANEDFEFRIY